MPDAVLAAGTGPARLAVQPQPRPGEMLTEKHDRGCARSWTEVRYLIGADLHRYAGNRRLKSAVKHFLFTPGFKYSAWMRLTGYLRTGRVRKLLFYPPAKLVLLHLRYKYGFAIPEYTVIGPGLFLNRFGGFYIHGDTVIGNNVNLLPGTMLGLSNRGKKIGAPVIGDRVLIGHGAKVIGRVTVGADSSVGANSVVTSDVPPSSVAVGMPARVVSQAGSDGYINRQADTSRWPGMARD